MVLAPGLQCLPIAEKFPITLFVETIQHILSVIGHLFGNDDANIASKSSLGFLRKMMQPAHLFDILAYLAEAIRFQLHHFPTTSCFRYYSLLFLLFVYTHVDEFKCPSLSLVASNKQRKFVFDWNVDARKRQELEGYHQFISSYMAISYKIIHGVSPSRVLPQQKSILQLRKDARVGN